LIDSGLDSSRFTKISYGKKRPAVNGGSRDSRAKNRRVEFKIIPQ
jgi:outer membrane protein OmpA-like peptidoglycan-associated protein